MKIMNGYRGLRRMFFVAAAVVWGAAVQAADPMNSQKAVEPGVWSSDYTAAKAYADAEGVPMLIFWANPGCSVCEKMEAACRTAEFRAWQAERRFVMVFSYGDTAVKKIVQNPSREYPYMMIYWSKAGSEVLQEKFSGKAGRIPAPAVSSDPLQKQLMDVMDFYTAGWDPDSQEEEGVYGGSFVVPDTEKARLEVLATATSVIVPLARTNGLARVATNRLVSGSWSQEVVWTKGEKERLVEVPLSGLAVGEKIPLTLEADGVVCDMGAVHVVAEPENSVHNPKWLGESFEFGEWTMDLAAARAKVARAQGPASTLVFLTGSLWCPWCLALENNVLDTEEFRALARQNQVALALVDAARRSPYDSTGKAPYAVTTVANGAAPTLLRYGVGSNGASGASYLSRKGIRPEAAEKQLLINTRSGYPGGEFCAPNAFRAGYPTLLLLDKQGKIKARFAYQADNSSKDENGAYLADKAENLQRLRDFIAMAADETVVENDKFHSTTTLAYAADTTAELRLQVCHSQNSYRLTGVNGRRVTFRSVADSAARGVSFAVMTSRKETVQQKDGDGIVVGTVAVDVGAVLASGNGELSYDFPETGDFYLRVSSFADYLTTQYGAEGTETRIVIESTSEPLQTENNYLGTAFSTQFPVTDGAGALVGTLTLTATRSNRVTARFMDAFTGKVRSYSGKWGAANELGLATARIEKKTASVALALAADGAVTATLTGTAFGGAEEWSGTGSVAVVAFADYAGYYTVVIPVEQTGAPELEPTGAGYVIVKANTSTFRKKGSVTCSVVFPNGVKTTGRGTLTAGVNGFANLVVTAKSGRDVLTIPMSIRPRAAEAATHRAVRSSGDLAALWVHDQTGFEFARTCGIYGSYYDKTESLLDCCRNDVLVVDYDIALAAPSEVRGDLQSIAGAGSGVEVAASRITRQTRVPKFSISASHSTGIASGKATITFADGKTTSAQFRGVILPDWHDCGCFDEDDEMPLVLDIPFVYGTLYFTDKVGRTTVKRSIPFGLFEAE